MVYELSFLKKKKINFIKEYSGYTLQGPLGSSLFISIDQNVKVKIGQKYLKIKSIDKSKLLLYKRLFYQKMIGILYGFKLKLKLRGIGYIANNDEFFLKLKLGFSSIILIKIPISIKIKIKKRKIIKILGCDLNEITQFAALIRKNRPPEIYKGKGILYLKEKIFLKVGKKN